MSKVQIKDEVNPTIATKSAASALKSEVVEPTKKSSAPKLKIDNWEKLHEDIQGSQSQNQSTPIPYGKNHINAINIMRAKTWF